MPPHRPPRRGPPHRGPHHHPEWFENEEKVRTLAEIGQRLRTIGDRLAEAGTVKIGDSRITPADECIFLIRYERKPRGELALKLEIEWDEEWSGGTSASDLPIE